MKLAKSVGFSGLVIALTVVGCSKKPDRLTNIPGGRNTAFTDTPASARDPGQGGVLPPGGDTGTGVVPIDTTKGEGIGAAGGDFSNWSENRDEFKSQTVYFDFDKAIVKASEVGKLEEVANRMKSSFAGKALRIEGHCDERGTEEYNRSLGDRRAQSIREKLVQLGLNPEMLPTITFGEDRPADPGHDDAAFQKNRRGELILLSPPGAN